MEHDDASLIESARRGSAEALSALYRRYWPLAWHWAYALTGERARADDLAQDAVLRAFRSLRTYDTQRPFRPWLKRILLNVAADELRRLRRGELRADWLEDRPGRAEGEPRASDDVVAAIQELPPARRLVIVLHYWLDLPVDEIAVLLDVPYGTVASRLSRGLGQLREALEEERV